MKNKFICKLLVLGVLTSNLVAFHPQKTYAADFSTTESKNISSLNSANNTIQSEEVSIPSSEITPYTAYDWWVYNLGVRSWGISKIVGPYNGGSFNTEGLFGGNRTFTISWTGAPSNANFKFKAVGQDAGNSGSVNYSATCTGSSGSVTLTIPYADRGVINLYADNYSSLTMNLTSIHVDSR